MTGNKNIEERRGHPRIGKQVHLRPMSVFGQNSLVDNISLGGMRVQSRNEFSLGETLHIQMSLEDAEWAEASVRVVWVSERDQGETCKFDIGCEFVNLPFDMQNELWVLLNKNSNNH
ncbi:PilZ domain-containing protein [Acidobacteriota bacterium]